MKSELGTVLAACLKGADQHAAKAIVVEGRSVFLFDISTSAIQGSPRRLDKIAILRLSDQYNAGVVPPIVEIDRTEDPTRTEYIGDLEMLAARQNAVT